MSAHRSDKVWAKRQIVTVLVVTALLAGGLALVTAAGPALADPSCEDSSTPLTGTEHLEMKLCKSESDDEPYLITGELWASFDITIEAGVRVEMGTAAQIKMDDTVVNSVHIPSTLRIEGTEEDPVVITSHASEPERGDWKSIEFVHGASADIEWADIAWGGGTSYDPSDALIDVNPNTPPSNIRIDRSSVSHSLGSSVRYNGSSVTTFPHFELTRNDFVDSAYGLHHISGDLIGNDIMVDESETPHQAMFLVRYGDDPVHVYANRVRNGYVSSPTGDNFPRGTVKFNSFLGGWKQITYARSPVLNLRHNWWGRHIFARRPTCETEEPPFVIRDEINGCDDEDNRPYWAADIVPAMNADPWSSPDLLDTFTKLGFHKAGIRYGDPVDVSTGNFIDARTDLAAPPAAPGLGWSRTYNSGDDNRHEDLSLLGPGWTTPFDASLVDIGGGDMEFRRSDGNRAVFEDDGEDGFVRPPETAGDLTANEDDTWRIDFTDGSRWDFDIDGHLTGIVNGTGRAVVVGRGLNGQPDTVTSAGYTLTFAYEDETVPTQVTSVTATKTGSLDTRTVTYTYAADGTLNSVTAGERVETYLTGADEAPDDLLVTEEHVATGETTERTTVINHYDDTSYGRIDYQLVALDDPEAEVTLSAGDVRCGGEIPVGFNCVDYDYAYTDVAQISDLASGDVTTYTFDGDGRILSVEDATGAFLQRTYDEDGNLSSVEDRRENTTVSEYDDYGRLTRVTTVDGGVTDYTYEDETRDARLETVTRYEDFDGEGQQEFTTTYTYPSDDPETEGVDESDTRIPHTIATNDDGDPTTTIEQEDGRVTQVTDPDGVVTATDYDSTTGELTATVVDPGGLNLETDYGYDSAGNQNTVTVDPGGLDLTTTSTFDPFTGQVTAQTDPGEDPTVYAYNPDGTLASVTDPTGAVTTYGYDPDSGHQTTFTQTERIVDGAIAAEPVDFTTTSVYDQSGDLVSQTTPGDLTTAGDPLSPPSTTSYVLGPLARVQYQVTDDGEGGLDRWTGYRYDDDGNQTGVVADPAGDAEEGASDDDETDLDLATATAHDAAARPTEVTNPADNATETTYNDRGLIDTSTDATGRVTTFTYDGSGRTLTTSVEVPGEDPVTTEIRRYTLGGRLYEIENGDGDITRYGYDDAGRQTTVTVDPGGLNLTTTTSLDTAGRPTAIEAPSGRTETFGYTIVDGQRVETNTTQDGTITRRTYSQRDELTLQEENVGGDVEPETTYVYDDRGNLSAVADPDGHTVSYTYDGRGNRLTRTSTPDETPVVETWAYDAADEMVAHTDGLGRTTDYTYDDAGRLETVADESGRARTYTYRDDGPIESITSTDGEDTVEIDYGYDETGRRTSAEIDGGDGATTYEYDDPSGQVTAIDGPGDNDIAITYDQAGRRDILTYPDGATVDYDFDAAGRLVTVDDPRVDGPVTYRYDPDGNLRKQALPHHQYRRWTLDSDTGRAVRFDEHIDDVDLTTDLGYDPLARLTTEITSGKVTRYGYDPAGQLTAVHHSTDLYDTAWTGDDVMYTYDGVGNRTQRIQGPPGEGDGTTETYTYDAANQLQTRTNTAKDNWVYAYDDAGRMIDSGIDGPDEGTAIDEGADRLTIDYDPRGLPATVTTTSGGHTTTETRAYDATDALVSVATDDGETTATVDYVWDSAQAVPQLLQATTDGTDTTAYTNGPSLVAGGSGRISATFADNSAVLFATDHNGSAIPTTHTGDLVRASTYDEWGQPTGPNQNTSNQSFGYRGELQTNTLVHLRARDYQPINGTFTTRDPLDGIDGTPTVASAYPYGTNDPVDRTDPSGERTLDPDLTQYGCHRSAGVQYDAASQICYFAPTSGIVGDLCNPPVSPAGELVTWEPDRGGCGAIGCGTSSFDQFLCDHAQQIVIAIGVAGVVGVISIAALAALATACAENEPGCEQLLQQLDDIGSNDSNDLAAGLSTDPDTGTMLLRPFADALGASTWTDAEFEDLVALHQEGLSWESISEKIIDRTVALGQTVHFNLAALDPSRGGITVHEMNYICESPTLRSSTIFYNGDPPC